MDSRSKTLALLVVLVVLAVVKPSFANRPKLDFDKVVNQTVCPIDVEINEDPAREPQKIKVLKCASDVNKYCAPKNIPKNECCQIAREGFVLSCLELEDTVSVYYPKEKKSQPLRVSVGCVCVKQDGSEVQDATPG